ncbi:amidase [Fusarium albosuccineum]|uniref:Amidase n=1 Tax=Fusarium albosuccineum TaxID=1237068 RepID=A0A8H4PBH1_9HYPO|nr:amidase [Fusarium albosuccineum]
MITIPYKLTATQVLKLLKNKAITVETYARSLLDRINENDGTVKAWVYLDPDFVLSQAQALDQIPDDQRGPLHGLAIGIKDNMKTKDMPTQYGSPIYQGHQPGSDSSAVAILRPAGALIFGKTTTTEFAVTNSGPKTTNPHDPNRTPGGSSCGSAAAVANLQKAFAPTFDTFGFFGRSVEDLQLLVDVFDLKDDEHPKDASLEEISVALIKTPMWPSAGPGTVSAINKAVSILKRSNIKVEEVSFPPEFADVGPWSASKKSSSSVKHRERMEASDKYSKTRDTINDLAKNYTAILTPSAVDEALLGLDDMGEATFNTLWTASASLITAQIPRPAAPKDK